MNTTELIKKAIEDTARFRGNEDIKSAEDMIPLMPQEDYPDEYLLNVAYGEGKKERFDIYYPDKEKFSGPYPVFIEVHGGAWYFGQKSTIEFKPFLYGLERGYACVSLDYSLSPDEVYPTPEIEIKKAIAYIKKNAEELNVDKDRVALWGGSAGAHLAALAAYSNDTNYLNVSESNYYSKPNVLVLWYGCFDYYVDRVLEEWIYCNHFGVFELGEANDKLILSNPCNHVTTRAVPTFLQHGIKDGVVPYQQSVYMYDLLRSKIGEKNCSLELLEDCDHADIKMFEKENIVKVFDFIDKYIDRPITI